MTRGIRNNNPLNIRRNALNNWQGKVLINTDGVFEQFDSMTNGYRAALKTIETYIIRHHLTTPRLIINRWAPPRVRKQAAKADTTPLNQQASSTSALPTAASCIGDPVWVTENDTEAYIRAVCKLSGLGGNEVLTNTDSRLYNLVWAMSIVECGEQIYDYKEYLDRAWVDFIPRVTTIVPRQHYV